MNMTCLEFHRRLTVDPADRAPELAHHSTICPPCAAFAQRVRQLERSLRAALAVDPPPELCARILLRQSCSKQKMAQARRRRWLALAASVLLAVGIIGGRETWTVRQDEALERAVLTHIAQEPAALRATGSIDVARINEIIRPVGTRIYEPIGAVKFARICSVNDSKSAHLVLSGSRGPVTVLVMPRQSVSAPLRIRDGRHEGIIVPNAGGSIAIVGERGESLGTVEARVGAGIRPL